MKTGRGNYWEPSWGPSVNEGYLESRGGCRGARAEAKACLVVWEGLLVTLWEARVILFFTQRFREGVRGPGHIANQTGKGRVAAMGPGVLMSKYLEARG